ncbi:MAG TPA: carbon-nitrogen hydrolase, partial [Blastocatellia bacterium]|nr:carbon-nitrogen hydrolase [Blastocatellia bacterium]
MKNADKLTIALAQIAPIWFDREKTLAKVGEFITDAAKGGAAIVGFGEALVPGYPFWIEYSNV